MSRPLAVLVLGLSLGAAGCVRGRGTVEEPAIDEVVFRGANAVEKDELEEKLATHGPVRRPGAPGLVLRDRQRLDPDALATDRRRIEAFYRERGYYRARVTDVAVVPPGARRVKVIFTVEEGVPVRVAKLAVTGLEGAPEAARKVRELPLREGDVFTESAYDATKAALLAALQQTGWATAEVTQSALVLPEAGSAEVTYEVRPGSRYRFGPVFVAGSSAVPRERIREEVAGAIRTGEWWDETRLARAQARVFELGIFGGVRVTRGTPDPKRGAIPVVIAVREAPFRTLRAGPGIALEATRLEANATFGWQHRNFLGDLRHVSTELRAGYTWVPRPFVATKEGFTALASAELQQPGAFTRYVDASARVEVERGILETYDFVAERLTLGLPLRLGGGWSFVPSYNLEVYQLSNTGGTQPSATETAGRPLLENCDGSTCLLTYLEQRLAFDRRDDPVNTRRGWYVAVAVQEGFEVAGAGYGYLRFLPEVRAFYPLGPRTVLAARARVGGIVPVNEDDPPPLVARFMGGGPLSMRGYYTNRLSPMILQDGEWVPVGGNGIMDGSLELRLGVTPTVGAVLFVDAGATSPAAREKEADAWQMALDPTLLQWAAGVGLRYRTPIGPLRLDVGVRLPERFDGPSAHWFPPVPSRPPEQVHREPIVAVHLALGEAF